jgi:hypothetical protein
MFAARRAMRAGASSSASSPSVAAAFAFARASATTDGVLLGGRHDEIRASTSSSTRYHHLASSLAHARSFARPSRRAPNASAAASSSENALKRPRRPSEHWQPVDDAKTKMRYWWNKSTGETTGLGEPRPTSFKLPPADKWSALTKHVDKNGEPTLGVAIGQMFVFAFGGALGVTAVSVALGVLSGGGGGAADAGMAGKDDGGATSSGNDGVARGAATRGATVARRVAAAGGG